MKKSELINLLNDIADDGSIDEVLQNTDLVKGFIANGLTLDAFKGKASEKEFKAYIDSLNDKHFEKALKTWKDNNLEKELEPFIKEKYPELITDPVQKQIADLKAQLDKEKAASARKDLLAQAISYANEKKIPSQFVERFLGEDLEKTKAALDEFNTVYSKSLESLVDERIKSSSFNPGVSTGGLDKNFGKQMAEKMNNAGNEPKGLNPWA
ncbi:DUF4355 domain-containing protein [Clostridium thermobutyricum]|uniref:DUF4355 domain-containing protein n=1 Tax=Clostridium thermobutyricum TaxID=29372 RepID=UPI0018A89254|nr:DUF4355 domain-containing protein [Clostridium thermobutyricum]